MSYAGESQALIAAARNRDVAAFESLLAPLIRPACQLAFGLLGDWQESEDAVQEAALRAWRAVARLDPETASLRPWFFKIVVNQCRSLRRPRRWSLLTFAEMVDLGPLNPRQLWQSKDAQPEAFGAAADLAGALRKLPAEQRVVLLLHFYLDLTIEETAKTIGISAVAAKSRLYRGLRSLRLLSAAEEVLSL